MAQRLGLFSGEGKADCRSHSSCLGLRGDPVPFLPCLAPSSASTFSAWGSLHDGCSLQAWCSQPETDATILRKINIRNEGFKLQPY